MPMNEIYVVVLLHAKNRDTGCKGWFETQKEAQAAIESDKGFLMENYYDHALIECVPHGLGAEAPPPLAWYRWQEAKEQWETIDELPEGYAGVTCFAMG